jgi:hypothetical protein
MKSHSIKAETMSELSAQMGAFFTVLVLGKPWRTAWDQSVSELWRTSLALTQAQKRVTRAHELLRDALAAADE